MLNSVASNISIRNTGKNEEQSSITPKPFINSTIWKTLYFNKITLTKTNINPTMYTISTITSDHSIDEINTTQQQAVSNVKPRLVTTTTAYVAPSSDGLSSGAIAGIIIGAIALICCCGICGGAVKSGHWETARVWVEH